MNWTQPAFAAVADFVNRRTGLSFTTRQDNAELGIRRAMTRAKVAELGRYLELIVANDGALNDLVNELTIGETYFFREPAQFQFIRRVVVPDVRQRRGDEHNLRFWSSACASGEEAFSLAILLEQAGLANGAHLIATDISGTALAKARQATYEAWSLRGGRAEGVLAYLSPHGKAYHVNETIRGRVKFAYLNLALDAYPSFANSLWGMDLILCRNVLIYFDRETIRLVAKRFYDTLADGGWLITASSDPPLWEYAPFEVVTAEEGIFYRRAAPSTGGSFWRPGDTTIPSEAEAQAAGIPPELETQAAGVLDPLGEAWKSAPIPEAFTEADGVNDPAPAPDPLDEARNAMASGDYRTVIERTRPNLHDVAAAILHVRALAHLETADAERACVQVTALHPLAAELHYFHAVLLMDLGRPKEGIRAVRRVLYLDRSLAVAHFTLASLLRDSGDIAGAMRAFRNVRDLCVQRPREEMVPWTDGEPAGRLAEIAGRELALLESLGGKS